MKPEMIIINKNKQIEYLVYNEKINGWIKVNEYEIVLKPKNTGKEW